MGGRPRASRGATAFLSLLAALPFVATPARPAAALTIDRAVVTLDAKRSDGFVLKGRFAPSRAAGIQTVELDFGSFRESALIARFRNRRGRLVLKRSRRRGALQRLTVDVAKGKFAAVVKGIQWSSFDNPVGVRLIAGAVDECSTLTFNETREKWTVAKAVPACAFQGPPRTNPSAIVVGGTPADIRVQVRILPGTRLDTASVTLVQLDLGLNPIGDPLAELRDDGDPALFDDVAGDGIFSCRIHVLESPPAHIRIAAQASVGGQRVLSSSSFIDVVVPPTDADIMALLDGQAEAGAAWDAAFAKHGDTARTRQETLAAILQLPMVASAEITPDDSIFIRYRSGLGGGLMLDPPGTPGSGDIPGLPAVAVVPESRAPGPAARRRDTLGPVGVAARPPGAPDIGNNKVLIWSPFNHEQFNGRIVDALVPLFQSSTCPKFEVTVLRDAECTLNSISTFAQYGTLVLVTHGALLPGGQVAFMSGEKAGVLSDFTRRAELGSGQLFVYDGRLSGEKKGYFIFRPSFIAGSLPSSKPFSVVFAAACSGAANDTMARAFIGGNALAYLGFSITTFAPFMEYTAPAFFTQLALQARSAKEAYDAVPYKLTRAWVPTSSYGQTQIGKQGYFQQHPQELSSELKLVLGIGSLGYPCVPPAPGFVETVTVPATPGSHAVGTMLLEEGAHYRLVIGGMAREQSGADFHEYDAFYCFASSSGSSTCPATGFPTDSPVGMFLQVNNEVSSLQSPEDFTGDKRSSFNAGHTYELRFSPILGGKLWVGTVPSSCGDCTWSGSFSVQIFRE